MLAASMRNVAMLWLSLLILSSYTSAQTVTGTVMDKNAAPLPGITVLIKGTGKGTSTNSDGNFTLNDVAKGAILVFSGTGYDPQEFTVVDGAPINIVLEANIAGLNEIVVVGYGTARKKDITGAVASVKAKDFNQGVIAAPDQLLQGKVAGLEITNNNGQPGAATTIKIRGNNSIRAANNPLYVIDGVPLDGRTAKPDLNFGGGSGLDFGTTPESNPLLYINPNDIVQIDVLKDASATAIYGSRGANGIIVVTTKSGSSGDTKVEFGAKFGVASGYMHKYKVLTTGEFRSALKTYGLDTLANSLDNGGSVDALESITQNSLSQEYNLALSGGNETGKYRASFLGSRNYGFIKRTSLDKYLANFAGQYKFLDRRLTLSFNVITGHTTENMALISNTAGAGGNLISYALNWNPTAPFTTSNGLFTPATNSVPNPLALIEGYNDVADVNVILGNISAAFKITDGLEYKFLYAINHGRGKRNTNIDGWVDGLQGVSGLGVAGIFDAALTSQTYTHTLNYNTSLTDKLSLEAVAGYEYWKTDYSNSSVFASQFNTNLDQENRIPILYTSFFQNANTQTPITTSVDPNTEIQSFFGRVNFNLSDKYYLTGTVRADGSSKFGENNKYGFFPSVGAKWTISNEEFLKSSTFISNLGLRASWGITGNQEFPAGASLEQFNSGSYNSIGQSNVANPDLKWENTTQFNIGLDYAFFDNRMYGSIDYYNKNTTDILFQSTAIQPAPASIFFINLPAHLMNTGFEFSVGGAIISKRNFSWDANINFSYNKNLLQDFEQADILTAIISGQGVSGTFSQVIGNDHPVNIFYLKQFSGFDQHGQQIIAENPTFQKDPNPHYLFGFSTTLKYNKLSLGINASGASGFYIYNNTFNSVTNISNLQNGKNVDASIIGSPENINASVAVSSRYLEKGDYLKFRNATFTYAFGDVGKYVKNLNVFVGGTNLFVITKFTGFDPEVDVDKNNNGYPSRNIEYIPYPTPRIITFGFNMAL
ncbi:MAG TPA: SusC/RagA family TonB-linked outer membrane protein [Agriterribacter sp.]|nr:SusC/RagA family TonB-linked outer membrane protein [Agriterribacter sp.]